MCSLSKFSCISGVDLFDIVTSLFQAQLNVCVFDVWVSF